MHYVCFLCFFHCSLFLSLSHLICNLYHTSIYVRAETNTRFARIFTWLHNYSNTLKVFSYTKNDFGVVILVYLVNIYIFKAISVIQ